MKFTAPLSVAPRIIPYMPFNTGPLVGRDADLTRLRTAIGLDAGSGGLVVVSGDAGIGKSRLVAQVTATARREGWLTATGHCVGQAGSALAYLPFIELLGTLDAEAPGIVERVLASHPALGHLLPARADPSRMGDTVNPGRVAESVHALLTSLGAERPTLAVIEDVHWADHSSRDLLTLLLTRGFPTAVGLVVTYRSDDLHRRHPLHETLAVWARIAQAERIDLAPLSDDAVRDLVAGIGGDPVDQPTAIEIARRSEGNPFFAEELTASAVAGQTVSGGLTRVLRARVEQLDETAQQVVRAVAVGGRQISHELLACVVGLPDEQLEAALDSAVEHHVLEACWPPAYTFRHALLGETVADSLLPGERLRLHRAYAAVLAERPDLAPASELARHAAAVGDLPTAVAASRAAAEAALAVGGPQDALFHFERALEWLGEDDPGRDEVTLRAAEAASVAGDNLRAISLLRDRLDHPGLHQTPEARADLLASLVLTARALDVPLDTLAMTREAMEIVADDWSELRVRVLVARLQALIDTGGFVEAAAVGDEVYALAERLGLQRVLTEIRTIMVRVSLVRNDLDTVESHLRSVLAEVSQDDPIQIRALHQIGAARHRRGDLEGALLYYDEAAAQAQRLHREWAPWGLDSRLLGGLAAYELGDVSGALSRLDVGGAAVPQPGRAFFTGARLLVAVRMGEQLDPSVLSELREWWSVDALSVVLTVMPGIDLLGELGDIEGALGLAADAVAALDATWGRYHAIVRIAALLAGVAATAAPQADAARRERLVEAVGELGDRARQVLVTIREGESPETRAWGARLEAELLRLRWLAALEEPPSPQEMVAAWHASVAAFDTYGHVFEAARSTARLAAALHAAGDESGARAAAGRARDIAERLGAKPLLREIDAARPSVIAVTGIPDLTPREVEVLALVARGLSNGQIGKQLFISTKTVSVHVSNVLAKLGASGRTEAAALARDRGLLP